MSVSWVGIVTIEEEKIDEREIVLRYVCVYVLGVHEICNESGQKYISPDNETGEDSR